MALLICRQMIKWVGALQTNNSSLYLKIQQVWKNKKVDLEMETIVVFTKKEEKLAFLIMKIPIKLTKEIAFFDLF